MKSTVSSRGQTAIPAKIRKKYKMKAKTRLEWIDQGDAILVVPVPEDPLKAFMGMGKGSGWGTKDFLEERRKERKREEREYQRYAKGK